MLGSDVSDHRTSDYSHVWARMGARNDAPSSHPYTKRSYCVRMPRHLAPHGGHDVRVAGCAYLTLPTALMVALCLAMLAWLLVPLARHGVDCAAYGCAPSGVTARPIVRAMTRVWAPRVGAAYGAERATVAPWKDAPIPTRPHDLRRAHRRRPCHHLPAPG